MIFFIKLQNNDYKNWLIDLKSKIKHSQIKASVAVNSQLILLYWQLGQDIADKQENAKWGSGFIDQLSKNLKAEFPEMSGFSRTNLFAIKKFYLFHYQSVIIIHQAGGQFDSKIEDIPKSELVQQVAEQSNLDKILETEILPRLWLIYSKASKST